MDAKPCYDKQRSVCQFSDLKESAFGHYYQYLIIHELSKVTKRNDEIDAYYNYIKELANYMFEHKSREISEDNFHDFHKWYCDEYKVSPSFYQLSNFKELIKNLLQALIIEENRGIYRFRYNYVYYYFVAKYLADNITRAEINTTVSEMCKRLYIVPVAKCNKARYYKGF